MAKSIYFSQYSVAICERRLARGMRDVLVNKPNVLNYHYPAEL